MAKPIPADIIAELESMVDSSDMATVLDALADISHLKAEHLASCCEDAKSAAHWDKLGLKLTKLAAFAQ